MKDKELALKETKKKIKDIVEFMLESKRILGEDEHKQMIVCISTSLIHEYVFKNLSKDALKFTEELKNLFEKEEN